jgi:hypothetical protein
VKVMVPMRFAGEFRRVETLPQLMDCEGKGAVEALKQGRDPIGGSAWAKRGLRPIWGKTRGFGGKICPLLCRTAKYRGGRGSHLQAKRIWERVVGS